jgi:hypothetical protein
MDNTQVMSGSLADFVRSIEAYKASAPITGKPILKFVKTGKWLLGVNNEECDGELAAVNPVSIRIGYVQWLNGQVVKESPLVPFTKGWPAVDRSVFGEDQGDLTRKYLLDVRFLDTEPALEAVYSAATDGGAKAVESLIDAVYRKASLGTPFIVPVVKLNADSYRHPQFGTTFKPVFAVQHWLDMDGKPEPASKAALSGKKSLV